MSDDAMQKWEESQERPAQYVACWRCDGKKTVSYKNGFYLDPHHPCPECHGEGVLLREERP